MRAPRSTLVAVVALLGLVAAGCGGSSNDSSTASAGSGAYILAKWQGTLHQKGMPDFLVVSDVRSLSDPKQNDVQYSEIQCTGHWSYLGYKQGAYHFREVINRDPGGSCKGAGAVTLTPLGQDKVRYAFSGGGIVSRGTLNRKG
jgi:hypothetical protein